MNHALVIGGGFGGIASALRLRARNYEVTLVDRCAQLGGRAQVFERKGFRHDAGPTVITAPFLFDELFSLFGKKRSDYVEFKELETWYRFHFSDGTTFDYGGTIEDTLAEIGRIHPPDMEGYRNLLKHSEAIFRVGFTGLADQPFHLFQTMVKQVPHLLKLGSYRTVWQMVARYLEHPNLQRAFSIHPLLVGGNPFETTSIYSLIHFLERKWGIHFAMGGTGALVKALEQLMVESGIHIRTDTTVETIKVENQRVRSVHFEQGGELHPDIVVSNTDPLHLYGKLLQGVKKPPMVRLKEKSAHLSMGLFVLFFGTRRQYPDIAHHTIWMGERFEDLLRDIFHGQTLPEDFSLYLHRPTATDPSFAPRGCDSFYVLAPVPNLRAPIDWKVEGPRLRNRIVKALAKTILPGLEDSITDDFYMTPEDFSSRYLSVDGSGFSVAPLFRQSAWFRYHNRAEGVRNLFLAGAGTHPGAGVPGVLCSAKVIDRLVPAVSANFDALATA